MDTNRIRRAMALAEQERNAMQGAQDQASTIALVVSIKLKDAEEEVAKIVKGYEAAGAKMVKASNHIDEIYRDLLTDLLQEAQDGGEEPLPEPGGEEPLPEPGGEEPLPEPGGEGGFTDRQKVILAACAASTLEDVIEPPEGDGKDIDKRIRSKAGSGWSWEKPYKKNGQYSWCGTEMGYVMEKAGLKFSIRKSSCPSCYRMQKFCSGTSRVIDLADAQPGDVVIWGNANSPTWGSHITILMERDGDSWTMHEGNAKAWGPGEEPTYREGVGSRVRNRKGGSSRSTYKAMFAYRFLDVDFE